MTDDADFLDDEQITRDLERLRHPEKPPSDASIKRAIILERYLGQKSDLEHSALLHPEREPDIVEQIQVLDAKIEHVTGWRS